MATDALSYTGINRAYSDFAGSRACEELINLRPATEGVVPVKEALVRMSNVPYYRVFIHYTTSGPKYIAIGRNNADVYAKLLEYDEENETWTVAETLFSISAPDPIAAKDLLERTYYAAAGNVLLFSLCDPDNSVFENRAFTWKQNGQGAMAYVPTEADAPSISYAVTAEPETVQADVLRAQSNASPAEVQEAVDSALNEIQERNPSLCVGPVLIATAYKTADGSTFWTRSFRLYDPVPDVGTSYPPYVDAETTWTGPSSDPERDWDAYFDKYGHAYETVAEGSDGDNPAVKVTGTKVTLTFPKINDGPTTPQWNKDTSIIRSIEVYASKPVPYLDTSAAYDAFFKSFGFVWCLPQRKYSEMDLGGQLLYLQASIPLESLEKGAQDVELTFGGNVQATGETLEADAGRVVRYGRILSYNARFHFFGSVAHIELGGVSFSQEEEGTTDGVNVLVRYEDGERGGLYRVGQPGLYDTPAYFVVAQSINVKEVIAYQRTGSTRWIRKYRMKASSSYNFSYCDEGPYFDDTLSGESGEIVQYDAVTSNSFDASEPDAINVTEQYNPFVFLVQHSYKAPGNVIDVQPQMAGITDASYGRDPLSVFTERGVYALTQGSADVLYGAFLPVSNSVVSRAGGGALPTEMGIFFLADGALWLLAGRRSTLVSDALHMGPHPYIRTCPGYQKISGGGTATPEYDVSGLVSSSSFEAYVRSGGRLGFNRFRMELLISNRTYPYTYVLSLKYRQWFKIGKCVWQDDISGNLLSTPGTNGTISVLDLSTETAGDVLVHMQTRPFSMGYRYIHMHRIVAMVRASLSRTAGEKLVAGLYGSDDLQEWKLLAYAKRPGSASRDPLKVSQLRTTSASRSWRYYTVCIGGVVPTDTDLGPIVVDYEPVIRRIG